MGSGGEITAEEAVQFRLQLQDLLLDVGCLPQLFWR